MLYHYTDFTAFDGIIRCAELRLNNILNMNDASEMRLFMNGICKATGISFNFVRLLAKPLFCGFTCGGAAWCVNWILTGVLPQSLTTLVSIAFAGVVYVAALLLTRSLSKDDILMLPKGEKIAKVLEKYKLIG